MKNLENFIHMHRNEFDVYQPTPEVWVGISTGITASAAVSRLTKLLGPGSQKLILAFAVTSGILAAGTWVYRSNKTEKTETVSVISSTAEVKETPEEAKSNMPVSENTKQMPAAIQKETTVENNEHAKPEPVKEIQDMKPAGNEIASAYSVTEPGDSFYSGIKTLTLKSFGYNFKIKRSDSNKTRVRILKHGTVIDEGTNSELVLKIEQRASELWFCYEGDDTRRIRATRTVSMGEIEILIPDGEVSEITAASSNIDLNGYTAPNLSIHTASGNITASMVKAQLNVSSASGKQTLTDITGELKCKSASGNVSVKDLHGNANIATSSGKTELSNSRGDISCASSSGNIVLNDIQGKLDLRSSSGCVSGESVNLVESCTIQTVSGNIDLGLQNNAADLSFDLSSVSSLLKIKKGSIVTEGKRSLQAGSGKIPVTGRTSSGSQLYR